MRPDLIIIDDIPGEMMSVERATALLDAFHAAHPEIAEAYKRAVAQRPLSLDLASLMPPAVRHVEKLDRHVRQSTKTGKTWPKPRGEY